MVINILVADDDAVLRQLISDIIKKQGYNPIEASNGKEAMEIFFSSINISLCILDVMMPIYDGWQVLEEIRERSDVPILMLTALSDERDEIKGLIGGADDYISKPFSYPILIARIESLLRKIKKQEKQIIELGKLIVNMETHSVLVDNKSIELNNKEFKLLNYLILNKGVVLSREKILEHIWGYDFDGDIRTIDAHIKMLRSKLQSCGKYIKTIRGTGYGFEVVE